MPLLTIADTIADAYYGDEKALGAALAEAINAEALQHIDPARLIAAPDCGLGLLGRSTAIAKLSNLVTAAKAVL
jgi:methionine synthase II (cobalamin-independent)